ncbi:MAG: PAS domain S-box protein [Verrucomicrobiota bacterium]
MLTVAVADLAAGPELSFTIFLLLPVMICAWVCTRPQRLAVCVLSACVWLAVEYEHSPTGNVRYWNAFLRLGILILASELGARAARQNAALELEIAERRRVESRLRDLNDTLEQKVSERTSNLEKRSAELAASEGALRYQAEVLQSILESMSDAVVVLNTQGQLILSNPEAVRWLGIPGNAISFRGWVANRDTLLPQAPEPAMTPSEELTRLQQAARVGEKVLNLQITSRGADGVERTATWNVVPLRNASDQLAGAVAVGCDVTDLKIAEKLLTRSNFELEQAVRDRTVTLAERAALLELSFDAIIVRDMEDRITYWNKGAEEMYGLSRNEAYGQITHTLFQTEFPEPLIDIQKQLIQSGRWSGELVHRCLDGRRITVATRWVLQSDCTGRPAAILESNSDITQHRQMEVALRRTLEQKVSERTAILEKRSSELVQSETALRRQAQVLQSILNSMGDGVIVADADGRILLRNPAAEPLLGVSAGTGLVQDALRRHRWRETSLAGEPKAEHPLIRALRGETIDGAEMLISAEPDLHDVWVLAKARPLADEGGQLRGTVMVLSDVTVRRSLEKQVAEISEREQRRIGQDLHDGVCQHLVSTAYACNMLSESLAERGLAESAQAAEIYGLINAATIQIRNLARALHPADLTGDGLTSALEELAETVRETTGIQCRCVSHGGLIVGDQGIGTHLYRIAQEAVNNAVKHSRAAQIVLNLSGTDDGLVLQIIDNGHGIQPGPGAKKGIGFGTMSYRARMIGASLHIGPGQNGGTVVTCALRQQ